MTGEKKRSIIKEIVTSVAINSYTEVLKMNRIYNFSAGPSMLPLPVLEKAAADLVCYGESGMSVMEMSHRSPDYEVIIQKAEADLRKLMNIPDNYKVLSLQGGASTQFAAVPLNLLSEHKCADYIISGQFSKNAALEAKKYGDIAIAASSAGALPTFSTVPEVKKSDIRPDADYVHICYTSIFAFICSFCCAKSAAFFMHKV